MSLSPAWFDMSKVLQDRLASFRRVLAAPRSDLLRYGAEPAFVQFGPVVVRGEHVLLLAVVTDRDGSVRAADRLLESDGPPHITVGQRPEGGGWTVERHSARIDWQIAGAPTTCPVRLSPSWSKEVAETLDMSALARRVDEEVLGGQCGKPVQAEIYFQLEVEEDGSTIERFVIVGGRALELYRELQGAFELQSWDSIRLARVSCDVFFEGFSVSSVFVGSH